MKVPESRVLDLIFFVESLALIALFFLVVAIWDSLPSMPPIYDVEVTSHRIDSNIVIDFKYKTRKILLVRLEYTITEPSSGRSLVYKTTVVPDAVLRVKHELPISDWCISPTLYWTNGLSVYEHSSKLSTSCFRN